MWAILIYRYSKYIILFFNKKMTITARIIFDYKKIYSKVPELTRIHGEPTYSKLQLLLNQIKANTLSVKSDLSGGMHGHIGIVIRTEDYEEVSPETPSDRPLMPAPLRIPKKHNNTQNPMFARRVQVNMPIKQWSSWCWEGTYQENCECDGQKIPTSDG